MTMHDRVGRGAGPILSAGSPNYEAALADFAFNRHALDAARAHRLRPLECRRASSRARRLGLKVSVRGSGHNWSGIARQDGMVIDVSGLRELRSDAAARTAEIGSGATNGELAAALAAEGLAFPLGHCASVSMSG